MKILRSHSNTYSRLQLRTAWRSGSFAAFFVVGAMVLAGCTNGTVVFNDGPDSGDDTSGSDPDDDTDEQPAPSNPDALVQSIWFAQTHVQRSDDPLLAIAAGRPALLKVHVVSATGGPAPAVTAELTLRDQATSLSLSGPATLATEFDEGLGSVVHRYEDSFTATIPAEWMEPGLRVEVRAGDDTAEAIPVIGAPTIVKMTMFDVYYFGQGLDGDYPDGWLAELENKWPIAGVELNRVPNLIFDTLVVPPRAEVGAARVSSPQEYLDKTGLPFDGEQGAALRWVAALRNAGGQSDLSLNYVNIYGVGAGGQAGGYSGVGNGRSAPILHHELGHALSLPHWGNSADYPYKGDMHGIPAPENFNETHAGPAWAFDLASGTFIPPTVQEGNVGNRPIGTYKADPMQGGGTGDQEAAFLLRHFSDYSVDRMRRYLESKVAVWNPALQSYARWDAEARAYTAIRDSNGVNFPLERDVDVLSLMASTSLADLDVNLLYPPIGPYRSGVIRTFDPSIAADRADAAAIYCPADGCDFSLRVVQGGQPRTYLLRASGSDDDDPLAGSSLGTAAVNVPARDGAVTAMELLHTPDAEINGLPNDPDILFRWTAQ